MRFLDRPYFLAGTAVPDWLSVADRGVRLRPRHVAPFADTSGTPEAELAAGILQHHEDDDWFHRTEAFYRTTGEITRRFRELLNGDDGHRPAFLGHITAELLLDAVLIERHPILLDAYYEVLARVDPGAVERSVNRMARRTTSRLSPFIPAFRREEFLRDYLQPHRLRFRLNQVLRRVKLKPLPGGADAVLRSARGLVEAHRESLLPAERFGTAAIDPGPKTGAGRSPAAHR